MIGERINVSGCTNVNVIQNITFTIEMYADEILRSQIISHLVTTRNSFLLTDNVRTYIVHLMKSMDEKETIRLMG